MSVTRGAGSLSTSSVVTRADRVLWRRTLDGAAVMPPGEQIVCLDRIGTLIWELVDKPISVGRIIETLAAACSVDADEVAAGTFDLLTSLAETGAIEAAT